jgi:lipopolysaccharide biosynthesis protein
LAITGSCFAACIPLIRHIAEGLDPNAASMRYAVYASYDRHGLIADYVVAQVEALARLGCRTIVVLTSPQARKTQISKLAPFSWKIVHRRNIGHDFGCYKTGIRQIDRLQEADSLILMNDSCYGPLFDLAAVDRLAREAGADIWGITDSWWKSYHLQSYYLRLSDRAIRSKPFRRFWITLLPYQSRNLVVRQGEVRLTQCLVRSGLTTGVLCPYQAVAQKVLELILSRNHEDRTELLPSERRYLQALAEDISRGNKLNPMHSFWDVLIVEFSCPFVKRGLLRFNPTGVPGLIDWPSLLATYTDYDISLIDRHLQIK